MVSKDKPYNVVLMFLHVLQKPANISVGVDGCEWLGSAESTSEAGSAFG
jgi:hypothetical protein